MTRTFSELHQEFMDRLRVYQPASIVHVALTTLKRTYTDKLEALRALPWQTLLIVKWVLQDEHADEARGRPINEREFDELRQRLHEFPEQMTPPEGIPFPLFVRRLVYQQIAFQREMYVGFIREAALLGSLPNDHPLRVQFHARAGISPETFMDLSFVTFTAILVEGKLSLSYQWFSSLQRVYGPALQAYFSAVSRDYGQLREFCRGLPDRTPKVASEYYESTPLRRFPFLRSDGGLECWHPMVFFRGMEGMVHSVLCEAGADYIQPFSRCFEAHIISEVLSLRCDVLTEEDMREILGKDSQVPDALLMFQEANIFVEAKAGLFDESVMTTGNSEILRHKTRALSSAIQQGWTASRGIRTSEHAPPQARNAPIDYLIIVTNRDLHASRGTLLKQMYPDGKLEYPDQATATVLPLDRIYATSIEEFERLMAAARGGVYLPEILRACVEADAKPATAKFTFEQHLNALKIPLGRSALVTQALDGSEQRLRAALT